jgi:hypothetical protein
MTPECRWASGYPRAISTRSARVLGTEAGWRRPLSLERALDEVERRCVWVLALLMLLDLVLLLYLGRGLTFYFDDWNFVTEDFGGGVHSLLRAHVGNISVFPIAVYKVLFHVVGLNHYAVFRLDVIVLHLIAVGLIFVLAARRVPRVPALLAAALILFLGTAWEDLLWAFQVGYMLSIVGGLAAWVALERDDRRGDVAAMLCVIVAAGSSSLGIPVMIAVAVELAWRRDWGRLWMVAVPLALYVLWYLGYGESQVTQASLNAAPGYAEDLAAAAFGGLVGRALEWGRPLALLGVVVLVRRLLRSAPLTPRFASLLAAALSVWIVTAVARSTISVPETSRYIYFGAVVIVLLGVELLREVTITPRATLLAVPLVALFAVTGFTTLDAGAKGLKATSNVVAAELGALQLAAAYAPPAYQPDTQRAPQIFAGPYLHTVRAIGSSPADTPSEILAAEPVSREDADHVLLALESPKLTAVTGASALASGAAPQVLALEGATRLSGGACVRITPLPGQVARGAFVLPRAGALIADRGSASATVALRRFGEEFDAVPPAIAGHATALLSVAPDAGATPWVSQISSASPLSLCGARG